MFFKTAVSFPAFLWPSYILMSSFTSNTWDLLYHRWLELTFIPKGKSSFGDDDHIQCLQQLVLVAWRHHWPVEAVCESLARRHICWAFVRFVFVSPCFLTNVYTSCFTVLNCAVHILLSSDSLYQFIVSLDRSNCVAKWNDPELTTSASTVVSESRWAASL